MPTGQNGVDTFFNFISSDICVRKLNMFSTFGKHLVYMYRFYPKKIRFTDIALQIYIRHLDTRAIERA